MVMHALERLNGFIRSIPDSARTVTPVMFEDLVEAVQLIPKEQERTNREDMRMQLGAVLFNGRPRVAYDLPMLLLESLFDSKLNPLDIPSDVLQLPHKCVFIGAYKVNNKGIELYAAEESYTHNARNIIFIANHSVVIIPAISGKTFRQSIGLLQQEEGASRLGPDYWERLIRDLGILLNVALFLTGGDLTETVLPAKTGKKARNLAPWEKTEVIHGVVGGHFQSALRTWQNAQSAESACAHGSPRPHLRAGHWHLYWTGKGRSVPKVQFLHPCLVNADSIAPGVEIQRKVQ